MGGVKPYMIPPPPPLPAYQPPPRISGGSQVVWGALNWSGSIAPPRDDIIYVLFINSGSGWREVVQTSARSTHMPPGVTGKPRLRLLAVTQEGIVGASDTFQLDYPTHHGTVEYTVEDMSPASAEVVSEIAATSLLPNFANMASTEPEVSESIVSEFYPYENFESKKVLSKDSPSLASIVDPTWALQVVSVKPGIMAEVKVVWDARGPEGIEYLLSWVEETGGVSGHLLTDQLSTDVSLWPGQGYYLQVELVDSQGNPVMKSLATPVLFKTTTANTPTTRKSTSPVVIDLHSLSSTTDHPSSQEDSNFSIQDEAFSVLGTFINKGALPPGTTQAQENQYNSEESRSEYEKEYIPPYSENGNIKATTPLDNEFSESVPEREKPSRNIPPTTRDDSSTGVSAREIPTVLASDKAEEEVLWYVGVSIGVLLVLILCSLVVWSLSRCRKVPRNDQYIEDSLSAVRASFREDVIRRHRNNPQTSWTFEKCNSTRQDPRLESEARKGHHVPLGIDNASVIENYLLMLESRPPKKKPRH
ncbi:hypothetical protein SK128_006592 [Halocaridina rubra]|uniref:Fibronectin type-III domain-containing protein n=1 Tax=Halocaridina rubra TaxID=373956 RepID=A0AAN8XFG6_HALRR